MAQGSKAYSGYKIKIATVLNKKQTFISKLAEP